MARGWAVTLLASVDTGKSLCSKTTRLSLTTEETDVAKTEVCQLEMTMLIDE